MLNLILPDGSIKTASEGESFYDFISREIGSGLAKNAIAVSVNGNLKDLFSSVEEGNLNVITVKSEEGLEIIRHSASHIMADAVTKLFPGTLVTIGPAIDNGFYYDFDSNHRFTDEDLALIEEEMKKIVASKYKFERIEISKENALKKFNELGEKYKVEIINELEDGTITLYKHGDFTDLCRGPHVPDTSFAKAFKLFSVAGAYWRGDEKNKMLQRIYGTAFSSQKELKDYIQMLEEAKERDHRKLGKELNLYTFSEQVGPGLVLWTPKGGRIRTVIENFWKREHYKYGYEIVYTPHIGRSNLWETSGHLSFYKDGMYSPMDIDGENYYAKPMNCPFHVMLYKSQKRSYRDFPFKWAELGTVYRYEKSGTLHGLLRVRGFTQDDAHLFCRIDQMADEVSETLDFSLHILRSFGFEDFNVFLSTQPEKSVGTQEIWDKAEAALKEALDKSGLSYSINEGDGAFYGPKIDIAVKDSIGRAWQLSTIQLDFNLPERFNLEYTATDGSEQRPIMIHRALMGSLERFFGVLIEHYKGALPLWLSPDQVAIIPVSEKHIETAKKLDSALRKINIRTQLDDRNEKTGYKVREWIVNKTPYIIVIGDNEIELKEITVRVRGGEQKTMELSAFIEEINNENRGGVYF